MSSSLYRAPFHRQLLPFLFLFLFLILAPLIVFYTSGYRFNQKKGRIERSGTIIASSIPSGASIFLDDRDTHDTTSVALQHITPGLHRIRLEKQGYIPMEVVREIKPEQVTFMSLILLWQRATPEQVTRDIIDTFDMEQRERLSELFSRIAQDRQPTSTRASSNIHTQLTHGLRILIRAHERVLLDTRRQRRHFELPSGSWTVHGRVEDTAILFDGSRWLIESLNSREPSWRIVPGTQLLWHHGRQADAFLIADGSSLWIHTPGDNPRLLWRQSEPITSVAWHPSGDAVFFTSASRVMALPIRTDFRLSPQTLATFDAIEDAQVINNKLYLAGTRDDTRGVWSLTY